MSILFVAGLPRSSSLGVGDLLYRCIDAHDRPVVMTGHLHLAAALCGDNLDQYHSPLHLYNAREALVRCMLSLHQMPVSLETYESILKHYFSGFDRSLNLERFCSTMKSCNPLVIDPSFSHAIHVELLRNLPDLGIEYTLLVIWRNPIDFCLDLMQGVYGFDCCLQWILAHPMLSFPLDPLMLWLEFVRSYLAIIRRPPTSIKHVLHVPRELISSDILLKLCICLSADYCPELRSSSSVQMMSMFSECPYSGDPSYVICADDSRPMVLSIEQLARFSNQDNVIQEVIDVAKSLGYAFSH